MPYVSMFFGIIIRMFYSEHNPPHFHAEYQGAEGLFDFNGKMFEGNIKSVTALKLIKEWAVLRNTELPKTGKILWIKLQLTKLNLYINTSRHEYNIHAQGD